jgi:hypothetical protein
VAKYITEVLKEINDDPSLFQSTYKKVGNGGPLAVLFKHAFTREGKFLLPEGEPPFKKDSAPLGMSPSRFIQEIRKFYLFCRRDLTAAKREMLFIQMCESIHPDEAKILIAVKDQTLTKLYPNITRKVVADAGFIDPQPDDNVVSAPSNVEVPEVKKPARPRGRPRKTPSPQLTQQMIDNTSFGHTS